MTATRRTGCGTRSCLDLDRIDILAAGDDHVLHPVDEEEVALIVEVAASPEWYHPPRKRGRRRACASTNA